MIRAPPSSLHFGAPAGPASSVDANSTITATCTNTTAYAIALSGGNVGATDRALRKMSKGSEQNAYGLSRRQPVVTMGCHCRQQRPQRNWERHFAIDHRIRSRSGASGVYTDTIVVTLTY